MPAHRHCAGAAVGDPIPDPRLERQKVIQILQGDLPSLINPPSGCVFRTRCPQAIARCANEVPALRWLNAQSEAACLVV
jgi:oligopeptide transport system ATP-binding protein